MKSKLFYKEKLMIIQIRPVSNIQRDVFLPSVYDALLVIRPSCNFRDGIVMKNANLRQYFRELPLNDGYLLALIHLLPGNYRSTLHSFNNIQLKEVCEINTKDILLGFAPVFVFIKSYASWLIAELSQLCYKGVLRTIALGSTDGLCTWRVPFILTFQPVMVPVGRIALGRIFNVVGSIIDRYMEFQQSSQFSIAIPIEDTLFVESYNNLTYTFSYPNHLLTQNPTINIKLLELWNTMIMNTISPIWICYIAYFYHSITNIHWTRTQHTRAGRNISSRSNINALAQYCQSLFGQTDTLFAQLKPIHKTPCAILTLSIHLTLFETGIKVVDLLTPYKKGGKIDLFGGAGVGKTVVIMEFIRNLATEHEG
jgi:hypothetical protein